jgi:hypothetical protein
MGEYRRPRYRIIFRSLPRVQAPALGHNGGPPFGDFAWPPGKGLLWKQWKAASDDVFKNVPTNIAVRRARKAARLGLTYREYTLEILERGRYLSEADATRIAEIRAMRGRNLGRS